MHNTHAQLEKVWRTKHLVMLGIIRLWSKVGCVETGEFHTCTDYRIIHGYFCYTHQLPP